MRGMHPHWHAAIFAREKYWRNECLASGSNRKRFFSSKCMKKHLASRLHQIPQGRGSLQRSPNPQLARKGGRGDDKGGTEEGSSPYHYFLDSPLLFGLQKMSSDVPYKMEFVRSATEQSVSVKPVTHEPTLSAVKHRRPSVGLLVPVSRALLLVAFNGNQDKTDFIFA